MHKGVLMEKYLSELCNYVRQSLYKGEFLLSTKELSNSWIYLPILNQEPRRDLVQSIFEIFFVNLLEYHPDSEFTIFSSEFTKTSEKEFPAGTIAEKSLYSINSPRLKFVRVFVNPESKEVSLNREEAVVGKNNKCIGVFTLSIHVILIENIIKHIRNLGGDVFAIVAIGERENDSRNKLNDLKVDLIPFTIFDEDTQEVTHILERDDKPYKQYHRYFHAAKNRKE